MRASRVSFSLNGETLAVTVDQRRFEPLARWCATAVVAGILGAGFASAVAFGMPPAWPYRVIMVGWGMMLFVLALVCASGLLMVVPLSVLRRGRVAFHVRPRGIEIVRPARRGIPQHMHRDALAGPFVRVDEAIDEEASATTMTRMGGADAANALAEGARSTGGSADTMTWFLFRSSAASVTVTYRGFPVLLAEGLRRAEAEEIAYRTARVLERLPG